MLRKRNNYYLFIHQNFRDFFSALWIKKDIDLILMTQNQLPSSINKRIIPLLIRKYLGEFIGEHHYKMKFNFHHLKWEFGKEGSSYLVKTIEQIRTFSLVTKSSFAIWNIINTIIELRGELCGIDLSNLPLENINFNQVCLSKGIEGEDATTQFNNSRLSTSSFLFQGLFTTNDITYNGDGSQIISGGEGNYNIRFWDSQSGILLKSISKAEKANEEKYLKNLESSNTLLARALFRIQKNRDNRIKRIKLHPENQDLVVASYDDGPIRIWSISEEKCIVEFIGHPRVANDLVFTKNGDKLVSVGYDGSIRFWEVLTGKCLKVIQNDEKLNHAVCTIGEGNWVLVGAKMESLTLWSYSSGKCLKTFKVLKDAIGASSDETSGFTNINGDIVQGIIFLEENQLIISAEGSNLRFWEFKSGKCIETIKAHNSSILGLVLSKDCLLYTSPSPRDRTRSRMPSSA